MLRPLCIYHSNCADGFGAAWVVRKALGDVEFHAGVYQTPPPDVEGRDVFIVDFSYKRPVLEEMARRARSITVLDHHKTAAEDLVGLPTAADWHTAGGMPLPGLSVLFDMNRSGAGITWDYFFTNPRPALLDHIEDRDLWRFALPFTREIQAAVFSYPYDFAVWDDLICQTATRVLAAEGEAIERKHHKDIGELLKILQRRMLIGGHNVPVANLPYTFSSDAGNTMARGEPFAACYYDTPGGRCFSLRSAGDGADVSSVAKLYGGGGHARAAGFTVPYEIARTFEIA